MKKIIHKIYKIIGYGIAYVLLIFWRVRDKLNPPKEDAILFVAHPDDDTLFFHTYIKKNKPYVVLLTTSWSMIRLACFMKAMKYYGVRYRAYPLESRDERIDLLRKYVKDAVDAADFTRCATHGSDGEYGHIMHQRVHEAVADTVTCYKEYVVSADLITDYPLSIENVREKTEIFRLIYTTELFVLDEYKVWVTHEKLEGGQNNE